MVVQHTRASGQVSADLDTFLARFNKGHKRKIANLKADGTMDQHEGKVGYSFTAFVFLAKLFFEDFGTATNYAHLFFVLTWNLIARAITVANMKYDFIHMDNDMIVVLPPRSKTDQAGERVEGKHIAANPFNPVICPVLSLARHVFSDGSRTRYSSVFTRDAYDRFGEVFFDTVRSERAQEYLQVSGNKLESTLGARLEQRIVHHFPEAQIAMQFVNVQIGHWVESVIGILQLLTMEMTNLWLGNVRA
ncbi:hypothetical protein MHU86_4962 [Fragilaria crotonensis]|nr:hypothetical protein MHU86_4962 [Fragilaria crotonensis]